MLAYASRTGTRRNLAALRRAGWRLLVSATGVHDTHGFDYALDNGAWTAHQRDEPFDVAAFRQVVAKLGSGADWIVVPDIVGGGLESLGFSRKWLDELEGVAPLLLAVQDGMLPEHVRELVGPRLGIFLGGSTDWKLQTMRAWGNLARLEGAYFHVGRVNSAKRIWQCQDAGADSFDGTSATRYAVTLPLLDGARRQKSLLDPMTTCLMCGSDELRFDPSSAELDCTACGETYGQATHT